MAGRRSTEKMGRDQNSNFVDDLIDKMVDGEVAVIVDLNNCIEIETEKEGSTN